MVRAHEEQAESVMIERNDESELLTVRELLERYRLLEYEPTVARLDARKVPERLRHLIPYAQIWGVADDTLREILVRRASHEALSDLKRAVALADDLLDEWLAAAEADECHPSDEYIAFSAMRMAADTLEDT